MHGDDLDRRLERYERFGIKLGLDNIRAVCAALGHPERRTPAIHIAGTNGKGSTAACVASVLREASYRVGLYTSPHLCSVTERFQVDGVDVTPAALERALDAVDAAAAVEPESESGGPTYFEALTAAAFQMFAARMLDAAVYEVGLGGRLDATSVVEPVVTCLTTVALDHTVHLGRSLREIAAEKAAIIKPGAPVVCGRLPEEAMAVVREHAARAHAPLLVLDETFGVRAAPDADNVSGGAWWVADGPDVPFRVPLRGQWARDNAACALAVAHVLTGQGWNIKPSAMVNGLAHVRWPGRMEWLSHRPGILFDGAHNPSAVAAAVESVRAECPAGVVPVFGVLMDKDMPGMCAALSPLGPRIVITASTHPRAMEPAALAALAGEHFTEVHVAPTIGAALTRAQEIAADLPAFVVGSLMNYAEARAAVPAAAPS